jgi:hypothetical protein
VKIKLHISHKGSALNCIAPIGGKCVSAGANNTNSKDRESKTLVGSAPDLGRLSDPEADPRLGQ